MITCDRASSKGDVTTTVSTVSENGVVVRRGVREEWHSVSWRDFCEWATNRRLVEDDINFMKGAIRIEFHDGARAVVTSEYQEDLSDATPGEGLQVPTVMVWPFNDAARVLRASRLKDEHTKFASSILGISYEEGLARQASYDKEFDTVRQMAKAAHFGFRLNPYLPSEWFCTWVKDFYDILLTVEEAVALRAKWDASATREVVASIMMYDPFEVVDDSPDAAAPVDERDPHTEFASFILGISYEEGLKRKQDLKDEEWVRTRRMAKAAHFSFPLNPRVDWFVAWAKKNYDIVLTLEQATALKTQWDRSPTRAFLASYVLEHDDAGKTPT